MKRRLVLIVAQDVGLRALMACSLRAVGHAVELAESARRAGEVLAAGGIDAAVVVSDGIDPAGATLIERMRDALGPGLVCCAPAQARDARELRRRVAEALAALPAPMESAVASASLLGFAGRTVDRDGRALFDENGREVPLTRREFALLAAFLDYPGRALSRERLRSAVAGEDLESYERSIDMLVLRLRRKIEPDPKKPTFILTVPGIGYKFAAAVAPLARPPSPAAAEAAPGVPEATPRPAERRLVSVLCCRILGIAALAGEGDPEEVQAALGAVHQAARGVLEQYGGTVLRQSGDGMVACFGYPEAGEDDAERAVRAGLQLVAAFSGIRPAGLRSRIGIATGPAVVGALLDGTGLVGAIGETPDRAEKLAETATDDAVVIGERTRRLAGRAFAYREAGMARPEGSDPVCAWRVVAEAPFAGRFAARRGHGVAEFIGRGEELALLLRRWWQARHGAGQAVLIAGEPGIGKSRLAATFAQRLAAERHMPVRCFGSPDHRNTELFPVIGALARAAGFARGDSPESRLAKLAAFAAKAGCDQQVELQLLAGLLSLPAEEAVLGRLGPRQRRERIMAALLAMIARLAAERPVFLLCEDAQWFDPTSRDLLARMVERAQQLPLLLIVTARPEFMPPWADHPDVTVLPLARLPHAAAAALIRQTAADCPLADGLVAGIVARGDGVPLFLEELTKAALAGDPAEPSEIPLTLQGLLMSRLDRLGPAREIAQIGAVIGPNFSHELLAMLAERDGFEDRLGRLVGSELVYRQGAPPDAHYRFKHALVRDAAYASLSRRRRRELHARIARALEEKLAEIAAAEPELLAHHHAEAGNWAQAIDYRLAAGERSLLRSAGAEARAHIEAALQLLSALPEDEQRHRRELKAQILMHRVAVTTRGRTAPEAGRALQRARVLCAALDEQMQLPPVIFGQWYTAWSAAAYTEAAVHARALSDWAERHRDAAAETFAEYALGLCRLNTGSLHDARRHLERAHALDRFDGLPGWPAAGYWSEGVVRVTSLLLLQLCLLLLGCFADADRVAGAAQAGERAMSQAYGRALALLLTCRNQALQRDSRSVRATASALLDLAGEHGYPDIAAHAMAYRGWALAMAGAGDQGLPLVRSGIERCRALGYLAWHSQLLLLLAECHWRAGAAESALRVLSDAREFIAETGERILEAELYRLEGEIRLKNAREPGAAERSFLQALETARNQGARLLELRAATALARLRADHGRRREARDLLAPVLARFEGGCDEAELRAARALRDDLA